MAEESKKPARDLPHVFNQLVGDVCKCFRFRDDPIHNPNFGTPASPESPTPVEPHSEAINAR